MNEQQPLNEQPLILVVDDDRLVLATLVAGLKQAGFEVIEADNGDDGILLARKYKPRLAILDMRTGQIRHGRCALSGGQYRPGFMFLSAFGDADIVEEATRMGALGYLVKPLDVRQIVPAVRAALARWDELQSAPMADGQARGRDELRRGRNPDGAPAPRFRPRSDALRSQARAEG
jgi:response regulator NasT